MSVHTGGKFLFEAGSVNIKKNKNAIDNVKNRNHDFNVDCIVNIHADGRTNDDLEYGAEVRLNANPTVQTTRKVNHNIEDGTKLKFTDGTTKTLAKDSKISFIEKEEVGKRSVINADKVYMYVEKDGHGRAEAGSTSGVVSSMAYYAPSNFGNGGVDGNWSDFLGSSDTSGLYVPLNSGNSLKASYIAPRINGFQFGFSYAPAVGRNGRYIKRNRIMLSKQSTETLSSDNFEKAKEVAVNYINSYGAVGFSLYGGYAHAGVLKSVNTNRYHPLNSWGTGLQLSYNDITIGGSYSNHGKSGQVKASESRPVLSKHNSYGFSWGIEYEKGPIILGLNYARGSKANDPTKIGREHEVSISPGLTYKIHQGFVAFTEFVKVKRRLKPRPTDIVKPQINQSLCVVGSKIAW